MRRERELGEGGVSEQVDLPCEVSESWGEMWGEGGSGRRRNEAEGRREDETGRARGERKGGGLKR